MRVPLIYTFVTSPFRNLIPFTDKLKEGMEMLRKAVQAYIEGDYKRFEALSERVCNIEHEADKMKREIRNSLPKGIFMPVDKFQFFCLVRELDQILDSAEDTVVWLSFKHGVVLECVKKEFSALLEICIQSVWVLSEAVHLMPKAIGFIKKDQELIKEKIREVRQREWESDQIAQCIVKTIFNLPHVDCSLGNGKIDCLTIHHLLETTKFIGHIADHAENAADILRAMIAK
ncbi:MAG: TIGR00153 family protein [Candidatus Desulfofervidaceae bacterium]|nr:TIGR00153 family protein [Candidatus Desulfofervidaceae bacterium]